MFLASGELCRDNTWVAECAALWKSIRYCLRDYLPTSCPDSWKSNNPGCDTSPLYHGGVAGRLQNVFITPLSGKNQLVAVEGSHAAPRKVTAALIWVPSLPKHLQIFILGCTALGFIWLCLFERQSGFLKPAFQFVYQTVGQNINN